MNSRYSGVLLMLSATFFFGAGNLFVKLASNHVSSWEAVFFRGAGGLLFAWITARIRYGGFHPLDHKRLFLRGSIGALSISCFFFGIKHSSVTTATMLTYTFPVFGTLLALLLYKEKTRPLLLASPRNRPCRNPPDPQSDSYGIPDGGHHLPGRWRSGGWCRKPGTQTAAYRQTGDRLCLLHALQLSFFSALCPAAPEKLFRSNLPGPAGDDHFHKHRPDTDVQSIPHAYRFHGRYNPAPHRVFYRHLCRHPGGKTHNPGDNRRHNDPGRKRSSAAARQPQAAQMTDCDRSIRIRLSRLK